VRPVTNTRWPSGLTTTEVAVLSVFTGPRYLATQSRAPVAAR
jgi:hypothetical protein